MNNVKAANDALFWVENYVTVPDECLAEDALELKYRIIEAILSQVPADRN